MTEHKPMTEQERKEVQDKMSPQLVAKAEYLMQLARLQSDGLAKTMTELADTMKACGFRSDSTPMRDLAKTLINVSRSLLIGGSK